MDIVNKKLAIEYFRLFCRPRRTIDVTPGADVIYDKHRKPVKRYRRVQADENDRGEEYPVCTGGAGDFSHFGIGVGLYFVQLLLFGSITFIGGIILLPSMVSYRQQRHTSDYSTRTNNILQISGVCAPAVLVNATIGCAHGDVQCPALYREDCKLPFNAALLDLIFCIFFVVGAIFNRFVIELAGDKLDEMIQTAQDYSVEVVDPNPDEIDPDTWYEYFSQFGEVKYITVTKKNSSLEKLLAERHGVQKRLDSRQFKDMEAANELSLAGIKLIQRDSLLERLHTLETKLSEAYLQRYEACRVYVTFESEKEKQKVLQELEVPGIEAILDRPNKNRNHNSSRHAFRGRNILDIVEPAEPNNIIWKNCEVPRSSSFQRAVASNGLTLCVLASSYFIVVKSSQPGVPTSALPIVIGALDIAFVKLFDAITTFERKTDEGERQKALQEKLFFARILLSTIFPYVIRPWESAIDERTISALIYVQISACFATAFKNLLDAEGVVYRNLIAPYTSTTQQELNARWQGTQWNLAERYTEIIKLLFISVFYVLTIPAAMFIATVSFLAYFLIDRFLLFRRWRETPLMGAAVARRLGDQLLICIAFHMVISSRYMYAWPFDEVIIAPDGQFEKIDKKPPNNILLIIGKREAFFSHTTKVLLKPYVAITIAVCAVTLIVWLVLPLCNFIRNMFYTVRDDSQKTSGISFSEVPEIDAYVPTCQVGAETFLFADISEALPKHIPAIRDHTIPPAVQQQLQLQVKVKSHGKVGVGIGQNYHNAAHASTVVPAPIPDTVVDNPIPAPTAVAPAVAPVKAVEAAPLSSALSSIIQPQSQLDDIEKQQQQQQQQQLPKNLGDYVPLEYRKRVLAQVKYYGSDNSASSAMTRTPADHEKLKMVVLEGDDYNAEQAEQAGQGAEQVDEQGERDAEEEKGH